MSTSPAGLGDGRRRPRPRLLEQREDDVVDLASAGPGDDAHGPVELAGLGHGPDDVALQVGAALVGVPGRLRPARRSGDIEPPMTAVSWVSSGQQHVVVLEEPQHHEDVLVLGELHARGLGRFVPTGDRDDDRLDVRPLMPPLGVDVVDHRLEGAA